MAATIRERALLKLIRDLTERLERVAPDADGALDRFDKQLLRRADTYLDGTEFQRMARPDPGERTPR